MAKHYKIQTVSDIFALPKESREGFVKDLIAWLELNDAIEGFEIPGVLTAVFDRTSFTFVDDGINGEISGYTVHVSAMEETE